MVCSVSTAATEKILSFGVILRALSGRLLPKAANDAEW